MRRLGIFVAVGAIAACGGGNKNKGPISNSGMMKSIKTDNGQVQDLRIPKVDPTLCDTKDKKVVTFDLNHDGRPDVWKLYLVKEEKGAKTETLTCKQVDLDHNGNIDLVTQYDADQNPILEEADFDYDGHFDAITHYDKITHRKFLVERDTDTDGKPDLWEEWSFNKGDQNEWLSRLLRDRNHDEKPDYWELYKKVSDANGDHGDLEAILYDDDFDGKVERRDDAVQAPPAPPPPTTTQPTTTDTTKGTGGTGTKPDEKKPGGTVPAKPTPK
jgi:hypothetical protein